MLPALANADSEPSKTAQSFMDAGVVLQDKLRVNLVRPDEQDRIPCLMWCS